MMAGHRKEIDAIARVEVADRRGTAFLISEDLVLSALHVVAILDDNKKFPEFVQSAITLTFSNGSCGASVVDSAWDVANDWVLLKCSESQNKLPIPIHELAESPVEFWTHGYSNRQPIDGLTYDGRVVNHLTQLRGTDAFQLYSDQIASEFGNEDGEYPVAGLSGAPVIVDGAAVGILRFVLGADKPQAGTAYATPIKAIMASGSASLLPPSDPFRGLPALPFIEPPEQPFRYLAQYNREHAPVFFGRDWEIRRLFEMVTAPLGEAPSVIFLTGQSGVGKSSLLTAGLLPRIENQWKVEYHRRSQDFPLQRALSSCLEDDSWIATENGLGHPLLVCLDQAEEPFQSHGKDQDKEIEQFVRLVQRSFSSNSTKPSGRLLLSFRKEWLQDWSRVFREHGVRFQIVRIDPLTADGVRQIVRGLSSSERLKNYYNIDSIDTKLADELAIRLASDRQASISPILQIWLTELWNDASRDLSVRKSLTFDRFEALKLEELSVRNFLLNQLEKLSLKFQPNLKSGLILEFLCAHITSRGDASVLSKDQKKELFVAAEKGNWDQIHEMEEELKKIGLLVEPSGPNVSKGDTRIIHDVLVPELRRFHEKSDLPGQKAKRIVESRAIEWQEGQHGPCLDDFDLNTVEAGLHAMRNLYSDEKRLIAASKVLHKKRRRRRMALFGVAAAAVMFIIISGMVSWQFALTAKQAQLETEEAYATSVDELINSMIELGFSSLRTDPALSLQLALESFDFSHSDRSIQLLKAAVSRVPVWTELKPESFVRGSTSLIPAYQNPSDPFLFDPNISRVLMLEKFEPNKRIIASGRNLVLREIPSGQLLGSIAIENQELLYNKHYSTSGIAIVRDGTSKSWRAKIHSLERSDFRNSPWEFENIVDATTSAYGWPVFTLDVQGQLNRLSISDDQNSLRIDKIATWEAAEWVVSNKSGTAIILGGGNELQWMSIDTKGNVLNRNALLFDSPVAQYARGGLGDYVKVGWGPEDNQVYILQVKNSGDRLRSVDFFAVDALVDERKLLKSYEGKVSLKDLVGGFMASVVDFSNELESLDPSIIDQAPYFFTTDASNTLIALTKPDDRYGSQTEMFRVEWTELEGHLFIRLGEHERNLLVGRRSPGKRLNVTSTAVSPNGSYTAIASFLKDEDLGGTSMEGVGILEQWGTFALEQANSAPRVIELTADPISTDIQESRFYETGMESIVKLLYSRDGTRLAACHDNGSIKVFRVGAHPSFDQIPSSWATRLRGSKAKRYGPFGRFAYVKYSDDDVVIYDFMSKHRLSLQTILQSGKLLDIAWSNTRETLLIATTSKVIELKGGVFETILEHQLEIESALLGEPLSYFLGDDSALFYRSNDFQFFGKLGHEETNRKLFGALREGVDRSNPTLQALIRWVATLDGYVSVADQLGSNTLWTLHPGDSSHSLNVEVAGFDIPWPDANWNSARRLDLSQQLWINSGSFGALVTTDIKQFDLINGELSNRFETPPGGWPAITLEIEAAHETQDTTTVILRYGQGKFFGNSFVAGVWNRKTGGFIEWVKLGDETLNYDDDIVYKHFNKNGGLAYVVLQTREVVQVVNLQDGSIEFEVDLIGEQGFVPYIQYNPDASWSTLNDEYVRRVAADVAVGGISFWKNVTTKKIPVSLDNRLTEAKTRLRVRNFN